MEKIANKIKTFYIDEEFAEEQKGDIFFLSTPTTNHKLTLSKQEYDNRKRLIERIKELSLEQVIEESAYTWFNRIIAIRYMEINNILPLTKDNQPLGFRVLSSQDNTVNPEILKFSNLTNPNLDIEFNNDEYNKLTNENKKFEYILLLVCKKLGKVIPQVFNGITDYIDLLIPNNLLNESGYITKVIKDVPEESYKDVEIIGWLYQYYNQTEKDRVMAQDKAYKKEEIPYVTQLFTPDWIVKYMVENSLGRYWIEHGGDEILIDNWKYYIKQENIELKDSIDPKEIKCIDPCSGSGHILIYMFEVLFQIYESYGYSKKDIPEQILKNNLYGLDIDDRAGQLSILSVILKARQYDKDIFNKNIATNLNIMSIQESNTISDLALNNIKDEEEKKLLKYLIESFENAKEIGSLLILENKNYSKLVESLEKENTIFANILIEKIKPLIKESKILTQKYEIVVTNPPYLPARRMGLILKKYVNKNNINSKSELCVTLLEIQ